MSAAFPSRYIIFYFDYPRIPDGRESENVCEHYLLSISAKAEMGQELFYYLARKCPPTWRTSFRFGARRNLRLMRRDTSLWAGNRRFPPSGGIGQDLVRDTVIFW